MRLRNFILVSCLVVVLGIFLKVRSGGKASQIIASAIQSSTGKADPIREKTSLSTLKTSNQSEGLSVTETNRFLPIERERPLGQKTRPGNVRDKISKYLGKKEWEIHGNSYSLLEDLVAIPEGQAPPSATSVIKINGFVLFQKDQVAPSEEDRLVIYDSNHDNVLILTGQIQIKTDGSDLKMPSQFSLVQAFPHLNVYFVQSNASNYGQLTESLQTALALPGVVEAKLDLIEQRYVAK